jgi:transketolase
VQVVEGGEDVAAIEKALLAAKAETGKPSLILLRTIIGYPAPTKMNSGAVHGSALGDDEVAGVKKALGFDPEQTFEVSDEVLAHVRGVKDRGRELRERWNPRFEAWAAREPERKTLLDRVLGRTLPTGYADMLPTWSPGDKGVATRKASEAVLAALGPVLPELWGGSADLAGSNNTTIKGADSFGPVSISTDTWAANPYGRTLHFGVREHAMGAILNGIALHGPTRPYGGTFLVFSDYMRPAVRLAALMKSSVVYVWTHDSIGLGEDGPTHQPVEHLTALRAIPGLDVVRPGDANETAAAWKTILEQPEGPAGLALTRQDLPILEGTSAEGVARGGYVLADAAAGPLQVVLIGTGSELQIAVAAREQLEAQGIGTRVVSMPCVEWFDAQPASYRDTVLPPTVRARVAVEAGIAMSWHRFTGTDGEVVSLEHYGASADYKTLYREFGITDEAVVAAAQRSLARLEA